MMNRIAIIFILFSNLAVGQPLYFSYPFSVSDNSTGNIHPKVTLVNGEPFLVWGSATPVKNLFYADWNGNGFNAPLQLTDNGENVMLGYAEGAVVKAKGDTMYVVYVSVGTNENRVYLRRSFDGGVSFSDTILVNDRLLGPSIEYANLDLDASGNPAINFIRYEIGDVPKYVFYKSSDAGSTFSSEVNATPDIASQPCECCPASMLLNNNYVYLIYRNNVSNIRDFYVSVSENGGISFDSLKRIDFSNYFSSSCPASGSSGIIAGDSVLSVFMTKINGQSMVRAGSMHKTTLEVGTEYFVDPTFPIGGNTMNYPEIAGSGDTIGIVWQDNRTSSNKVYIATSTTGLKGLSAPQLISDFTNNISVNPHIVYSGGFFHITWRDFSGGNIWYRKASFDPGILSVEEFETENINVYPNPATDNVIIQGFSSGDYYEIVDLKGRIIQSGNLSFTNSINISGIVSGMYFLRSYNKSKSQLVKLIIER